MTISSLLSRFFEDDTAAVTVDWVVLTAALVTMAIAVVAIVKVGMESGVTSISNGVISTVSSALS